MILLYLDKLNLLLIGIFFSGKVLRWLFFIITLIRLFPFYFTFYALSFSFGTIKSDMNFCVYAPPQKKHAIHYFSLECLLNLYVHYAIINLLYIVIFNVKIILLFLLFKEFSVLLLDAMEILLIKDINI